MPPGADRLRDLVSTPFAPGLGIECPSCHEVHHRCIGHYERADGPRPCGRVGTDGQERCGRHGGEVASPARARARRAAIAPRSKALSTAIATLNALGVPIDTDPLDALRAQVRESAGIVAYFRERLQQLRVPDPGDAGGLDALWGPDHTGDQTQHILLGLYNEERDRFAKLAKLALDAGIDEREIRVLEHQAVLFADVMRKVLDDPDLGLTPQQRQRGRQIAAGHLRILEAS